MADPDDSQKSDRRVLLRLLDGASPEGLQGVQCQFEDEIRVLQRELEEVERRIKEKQGLRKKSD
jgi:hypothetical protein